jgi:hypothetical protein
MDRPRPNPRAPGTPVDAPVSIRPRARRDARPAALEILLAALATDGRPGSPAGRAADGLVAFKSVGRLVTVLGLALGRLVTRRALARYLCALRRHLREESSARGLELQTDRWLGWRVVPRAAAPTAGAQAARRSQETPAARGGGAVRLRPPAVAGRPCTPRQVPAGRAVRTRGAMPRYPAGLLQASLP